MTGILCRFPHMGPGNLEAFLSHFTGGQIVQFEYASGTVNWREAPALGLVLHEGEIRN